MTGEVPEAADEVPETPGEVPETPGEAAPDLGLAAERDRLARHLREARLQLSMTQMRLAALEQSSTLELGRTLVRAARRPLSKGAQLPRDLFRMWRSGGATQANPAALALAVAQLADLAGGGERMLSALTAPGLTAYGTVAYGMEAYGSTAYGTAAPASAPPRLVVTGALTARTCVVLAPDAVVQPLLPHDADVVLESSGADLVLIEAAAVLAGSPWAYAVDPAAADRGRRLGRLIATARSLGKPVIFIRNAPAYLAPGLDWVAASCDGVIEDGFGVQLALFNPIGVQPARAGEPVYAGARDPRESPALRALLDSITGDSGPVRVSGDIPWQRLPALYREHRLFVTGSAEQARAQRACGARVIMADGTPAEVLRQVSEAEAQDPPGWAEIQAVLRDTFEAHATAVRLAEMARMAGLPGDMIAGRQIAVLAAASAAETAQTLAGGVLRQRLRPAELVVCVDGDEPACRTVAAALTAVTDSGVRVQVIPAAPGRNWLRAAADVTVSPWAAPWEAGRDYPETYLLDLACARECAQADAVGSGSEVFGYGTSVAAGIARRDLIGPDRLDIGHGLRLFSVSEEHNR